MWARQVSAQVGFLHRRPFAELERIHFGYARSTGQRSYSRRNKAEIVPVRCRPPMQCTATGKLAGSSNSREEFFELPGGHPGPARFLAHRPLDKVGSRRRGHVIRLAVSAGPAWIDQAPAELRIEQLQRKYGFHAPPPGQILQAEFGWLSGAIQNPLVNDLKMLQMVAPQPEVAAHECQEDERADDDPSQPFRAGSGDG